MLIGQLKTAAGLSEPCAETWNNLTHFGLVKPYGGGDLGQHWFR